MFVVKVSTQGGVGSLHALSFGIVMDLQWCPRKPDNFITWSQEISLYQVEDIDPLRPKQSTFKLSETRAASLVAKIVDLAFPKVVDGYPGNDAEGMIAVGLANGKVVLTSFGSTIISKEFVPKHPRQVNDLAWNKYSPNLLAAALDKARSDYAVAIWDVAASSKLVNGFHSDALRPAIELGNSETAHSIAWVQSKTLLVGMNGKHIRHYDLRDSQPKLGSTASTKAIYGICVDGSNRVASYADNQVFVWDIRNFEKPFVCINHAKPIVKIGWSPTRSGLLACLEKESSFITLHDVHHATLSTEEGDPTVLERRLTPVYSAETPTAGGFTALSAFSWHPAEENLITTVTLAGYLRNSTVFERVTLNWSSTSKLGWSNGKKIIQFIDNTDGIYATLDDISIKMKYRANAGYGLKTSLKDNARFVEEDVDLLTLWEWLDYCRILTDKEKYRPSVPLKSDVIHNNSFEMHSSKTYRSEERAFAQQICGWGSDLNDLSGSSTRRAALSLFHLKLRQAIRILNESGHSIIGMAIAGFSDEKNSLWREMAQTSCPNLDDPYVRAIFAFLTEADTSYETILNEKGLSVADRVGFACSFLSDSKLVTFLQELTNEMVKTGNLDGILLTGMTPQAIPLLQRYLDITGDVQTVSLLAIRTMAADIPSSPQLQFWIERYRELLDSWKLWEQRAEFDIVKNTNNPLLISPPEVTISCNFCGKNISPAGFGGLNRSNQLFNRFTTTNAKVKSSCCPSCRKPLPRCAICLLHMGTILASATEPIFDPHKTGTSPEALSWYTWCQTCRHGGHTAHLQQWFQNQIECPVTGCSCKCMTLDKVIDFPV
ncbi:unnamed protein product [Allacma fusca]|uniref:WD repeat protein mio zinc-ribbon like domain-containing protein n=1 Tax=Allacma fusca TaxID=39272 RepID=A0A8J2LRG0_9HEXA|nr:unnamed protein product [Allacma fusca]